MIHKIFRPMQITIVISAVALCLLLSGAPLAADQDFVVVVNKKLKIDNISSSDLEAIFTGKRQFWDSGEKVVFAVFDEAEVLTKFLKRHVKKTPSQFITYWKKMVFTGKAIMPEYLKTPEEVIAFVSAQPGAISFIPAPGSDKVKILNIN